MMLDPINFAVVITPIYNKSNEPLEAKYFRQISLDHIDSIHS